MRSFCCAHQMSLCEPFLQRHQMSVVSKHVSSFFGLHLFLTRGSILYNRARKFSESFENASDSFLRVTGKGKVTAEEMGAFIERADGTKAKREGDPLADCPDRKTQRS